MVKKRELPEINSWITYPPGLLGLWSHARVVGYTGDGVHPIKCRMFLSADVEDWGREDWTSIFPGTVLSDEYAHVYPFAWKVCDEHNGVSQLFDKAELEFVKFAGEVVGRVANNFTTEDGLYFPYDVRVAKFGLKNYRVKLFCRKYYEFGNEPARGGYGESVRMVFDEKEFPVDIGPYVHNKTRELYTGTPMADINLGNMIRW